MFLCVYVLSVQTVFFFSSTIHFRHTTHRDMAYPEPYCDFSGIPKGFETCPVSVIVKHKIIYTPILRPYVSKIKNSAARERFDKSCGAWWSKRFAYYSSCFDVKRIFSQNAVLRSRTVFFQGHMLDTISAPISHSK